MSSMVSVSLPITVDIVRLSLVIGRYTSVGSDMPPGIGIDKVVLVENSATRSRLPLLFWANKWLANKQQSINTTKLFLIDTI